MSRAGFAPRLDRTIEPSPRAPTVARRAVEELAPALDLRDPGEAALLRDLQLLVSELVTNSVRHSGSEGEIHLRGWVRESGVRIEVSDGGFGFEEPREPAHDDAESGRGLLILEALVDRWGVSRGERTSVWFEVRRDSRRARAAS